MTLFEAPVMNIVALESVDIITTSIPDMDDEGFNNEIVKP